MQQQAPVPINPDEAKDTYGITSPHEKMPNGELRFRLASKDGSVYIRTESTPQSGWQCSHLHTQVCEVYVVQSGWMALASFRNGILAIQKVTEGEIAATERLVPHNVYLPAGAVIHTVKHGKAVGKDWQPFPALDKCTKSLSEEDVVSIARARVKVDTLDPRFGAYTEVYNNLDSLIWQVPGFFLAAAAIFFGFIASSFEKRSVSLPPGAWACLFLFIGLLFLIGAYSMQRIRLHHTRMGDELMLLEPSGYFHARSRIVRQKWPPSASEVFIVFFSILGAISLVVAVLAIL